jgi:hypothetical protein
MKYEIGHLQCRMLSGALGIVLLALSWWMGPRALKPRYFRAPGPSHYQGQTGFPCPVFDRPIARLCFGAAIDKPRTARPVAADVLCRSSLPKRLRPQLHSRQNAMPFVCRV